jgi:hypothetical protein
MSIFGNFVKGEQASGALLKDTFGDARNGVTATLGGDNWRWNG